MFAAVLPFFKLENSMKKIALEDRAGRLFLLILVWKGISFIFVKQGLSVHFLAEVDNNNLIV